MIMQFLHITLFFLITSHNITGQVESSAFTEDEIIEGLLQKEIVGLAAGYSINDSLFWENAMGWSDERKEIPFTPETRIRIASIAKPMTAMAIMQLVEKEVLDLDAPIQDYLPLFPIKNTGTITIRHLLSHTSGIPGYKNAKEAQTTREYANLWDATKVFMDRKRGFTSGTNFQYTTYGYVVLGAIIERMTGQSFEEYMQQHIWYPAGMHQTGIEHYDQEYADQSALFHFEKNRVRSGKKNNLSNRIPGGGFYSTVGDVLRFGNAFLNNELISEERFKEMIKIQAIQEKGNPYGLGWFLYGPAPHKNMIFGHTGEQTGCSAVLLIHREKKIVVTVLANTSGKLRAIFGGANELLNSALARNKDE